MLKEAVLPSPPWRALPGRVARGLSCAFLAVSLVSGAARAADTQVDGLDAVCLSAPGGPDAGSEDPTLASLMAWARRALDPHPSLSRALTEAAPELCLAEGLFGMQGYFSLDANRIVIDRNLPDDLMRAVLIHELRHVHQSGVGMCASDGLSMEATAQLTLTLEADASVASLEVAWSLREAGDAAVWEALAGWPTYADLALAFEAEMRDSGALVRAAAAVFDRWFASDWRRRTYYLAACSEYLDRQDETHALPVYGTLSPEYLSALCRLSDGRPYPCEVPEIPD